MMVSNSKTYELVQDFKKRYPLTLSWFRVKKHVELVDKSLHDNEKVLYAIVGQWNEHDGDWFDTAVLAVTNERIIVAQNRLIGGYRVISVTPKFFNDVEIGAGVIWGEAKICTMKEKIEFDGLSKKSVIEIKKNITSLMDAYKGNNPLEIDEEPEENS